MKTATATEVKNRFGQFVEAALTEPVAIQKSGRRVAVLLSSAEYERLSQIEDEFWALRAAEAEREGYLGARRSLQFLRKKRNAKA